MSDRTFTILRYAFFFGLVFFGTYTLLTYLGVDQHLAVLLDDDAKNGMVAACGDNALCREWYALVPFVRHAIGRMHPYAWYLVWSAIAFAAVLGRTFLRDSEWRVRLRMTPAKLFGLFAASVWLFFTLYSVGSEPLGANDSLPHRRLFDVSSSIYPGSSQQELQAFSDTLQSLKDRGCLTTVGSLQNGAGNAYDIKMGCMQMSFVTRVVPQMAMILVVFFSMLVLGSVLLRRALKLDVRRPILEFAFSLALGACGYMASLWLLAVLALLLRVPLYSLPAGWLLVLGIPAVFWKTSLEWLRRAWSGAWEYDAPWYGTALLLGWLLLSYLAFNFLAVVRPFPIGWDDLGRYLNQPHLLVSYGHFIPTMPTFQWEYITSLGYLLFGYDSYFGATLSMMMNWAAGAFAIVAILAFGYATFGVGGGLVAAILYYTLPLVGHFSFADMKIDNALFAVGALSMLALFIGLFRTADDDENDAPERGWVEMRKWIILAGVFAGFALGMKATAIMVAMALGSILVGSMLGGYGFAGSVFLSWFVYTQQNRFNVAEVSQRVFGSDAAMSRPVVMAVCFLLGVGLLGYAAYRRTGAIRPTLRAVGVLLASFIAAMLPWLAYNNVANGNLIPDLSLSVPNTYAPAFVIGKGQSLPDDNGQKVIALPDDLRVDLSNAACSSTARTEELDRYWGQHAGIGHYLTLPWRSVMNLDSAGYYVTMMPALLLFPLLLLLPFFWMRQGRWLRWLFAGTAFLLVQWVFFANGIPWYGIGMFLGLVIALEAFVARAPDVASASAASLLLTFSLLVSLSHRFWQYEQQSSLLEYPIGKISAEALEQKTITHYGDIRRSVEARAADMPQQPYLYRIGTFIPYFIPQNLERIGIADQQLDFFNCLNQEKNPALTLKRLQALGFNSIVFDTNTQTIEKDENGSLHKKVNAFADFANTPGIGLSVSVYDPAAGIAYILLPKK